MNSNVEVWNMGDLLVVGTLIEIVTGANGNILGVVQGPEGWLAVWPIQAIKVISAETVAPNTVVVP